MYKTIADLNLNYLKDNHERLYYFGLGFIQLKLNETHRLHFYHPSLPRLVETPHNHRYDFLSRILSGEIVNTRYELREGASHLLVKETCTEDGRKPEFTPAPVSIRVSDERAHGAGDCYFMPHEQFHTVEAKECITLLSRSPYKKEHAEVLSKVGAPDICPFSKKIPEETLWELIEEMIAKGKRP